MKNYFQKRLSLSTFILILLLFLFVSFSASGEPYNYREVWNSWTDNHRNAYLWGLKDGIIEKATTSVTSVLTQFPAYKRIGSFYAPPGWYKYLGDSKEVKEEMEKIEKRRKEAEDIVFEFVIAPAFDIEIIRDIVTDLYKDPSNSLISLSDMSFLSFWKLKGESIETVLIELRKKAVR